MMNPTNSTVFEIFIRLVPTQGPYHRG